MFPSAGARAAAARRRAPRAGDLPCRNGASLALPSRRRVVDASKTASRWSTRGGGAHQDIRRDGARRRRRERPRPRRRLVRATCPCARLCRLATYYLRLRQQAGGDWRLCGGGVWRTEAGGTTPRVDAATPTSARLRVAPGPAPGAAHSTSAETGSPRTAVTSTRHERRSRLNARRGSRRRLCTSWSSLPRTARRLGPSRPPAEFASCPRCWLRDARRQNQSPSRGEHGRSGLKSRPASAGDSEDASL